MKIYRQCELKKNNTYQTAWLEEKPGLEVGKLVELKSEAEDNKLGWEVLSMGGRANQEFLDVHRAKI